MSFDTPTNGLVPGPTRIAWLFNELQYTIFLLSFSLTQPLSVRLGATGNFEIRLLFSSQKLPLSTHSRIRRTLTPIGRGPFVLIECKGVVAHCDIELFRHHAFFVSLKIVAVESLM